MDKRDNWIYERALKDQEVIKRIARQVANEAMAKIRQSTLVYDVNELESGFERVEDAVAECLDQPHKQAQKIIEAYEGMHNG